MASRTSGRASRAWRGGSLTVVLAFVALGCADPGDAFVAAAGAETVAAGTVTEALIGPTEPSTACGGTGAHDAHTRVATCVTCHPCGGTKGFASSFQLPSGTVVTGGTMATVGGTTTCSVGCHNVGGIPSAPAVAWNQTGPLGCTSCHSLGVSGTSFRSAHAVPDASATVERAACQGCHVTDQHVSGRVRIDAGDGIIDAPRSDPTALAGACQACHDGSGKQVNGRTAPVLLGWTASDGDWHGARSGTGFGTSLTPPLGRGEPALACKRCHNSHVSENAFLFTAKSNDIVVPAGSITRAGVGAEALCLTCHVGGNRHAGCMTSGCHTADPVPAPSPCFFCHGHEGLTNFALPSWAFHPDESKPEIFCNHCHDSATYGGSGWFPRLVETTPPTLSAATVVVEADRATIRWTTNEPATSFVEWGTTAPTRVVGKTEAVNAHEVTLTGLTAQTTYVYRVRSSDPLRNVRVGTTASFTTPLPGAPPAPTLVPNRSVAVFDEPVSVRFAWNPVTTISGNAPTYRLQVSNGPSFGTLVRDVTTSQTSYTTDLLVGGSYYYWRVQALDGAIPSAWSAVETTFLYWDW